MVVTESTVRQEIETLTKEATAAAAKLFTRLCHLNCITAKEIEDSYSLFRDSMAVAEDVLKCCKMPYQEYLRTDRWKKVAQHRVATDNFRCQDCGDSEFLSVHHKTYENRGMENLDDLITLCDTCHRKRHWKP